MELQHRFTVPASIDVAWDALNDVRSIGSCFPGATVTSAEGDEFAGTCKIKLGPISMQYAGSGTFLERDAGSHRSVIEAKGKDKRGNGTAAVTITTSLAAETEDRTAVAVDTELNITGKPAQFGRGVMQDVSDKLLGQFAECLESTIGAPAEPAPAVTTEPAGTAPATGGSVAEAPAAGDDTPHQPPPSSPREDGAGGAGSHRASSRGPAPTALDLGVTVLPVLARRYGPHAIATVLLVLLLRKLLRRQR
ncbi:MAG: SRPBCC domain-containing protein [Nocardioidaceae bacterium]